MHTRIALTLTGLSLLLFPAYASADSLVNLEAQLQSLLAQLASLNQQITLLNAASSSTSTPVSSPVSSTTTPASAVHCIALTHAFGIGSNDAVTGGEVSLLQQFLAGALQDFPAGNVTGHFGPLTLSALKEWQSNEGIVSSGDAGTTGWGAIGPKTRAALSAGCSSPATAVPSSMRSASINISLTSPLSASVTATVNTKGSCAAQTYALDYGDGSPKESIVVPGGSCQPVSQTFPHTYAAPGSYTAVITSGSLTVPLTVTIQQQSQSLSGAQTTPAAQFSCTPVSFPLPVVQPLAIGNSVSVGVLSYTDTADSRVTLSATGTPPGMAFTDQPYTAPGATTTQHLWSLTGAPDILGTYQLTINTENPCGGTQTAVQVLVINPGGPSCPLRQMPVCQSWQSLKYLGLDSNNCSLGYLCY